MGKDWNYARLSQLAKANGGPEKLVEKLVQKGIELGKNQSNKKLGILLPVVAFASLGIGVISAKLIDKYKFKKDKISAEEIAEAKNEIITGIKEYDKMVESNPEIEPLPELSQEEADKEIDELYEDIISNEE